MRTKLPASTATLAAMTTDSAALLTEHERRRLWFLASLPMTLAAGAYVGQILSATLASNLPVALIALAPSDPFLILTVNEVPTWAFFVVGFVRLVLPDPLLYRIGIEFGSAAKSYLAAELGTANKITRALSWLDRWFPKFGPVIVFALPNYPVCLLSGITKMRLVPFVILNAAGTATRLYVIWRLGRLFSGPVERTLELITKYQLPFTAVMVALVIVQMNSGRKTTPRAPDVN